MFEATPIDPYSEREIAAKAGFSVEDYGRGEGSGGGPYQIVMPTYPAPKWLQQFAELGPALRECSTLCQLRGRPFRVVRWGREGSGRAGSACEPCARRTTSRFARPICRQGLGCLSGYPNAHPIAEFRPNGQKVVYNNAGDPQLVGKPNYVVSSSPFPRLYQPERYTQRYLDAVAAAKKLAQGSGRRAFICTGFGSKPSTKRGVPVVYVDPGGLVRRYPQSTIGTVVANPVSPEYFQQLVAESRGRSYLGQGA